MKKDFLSYIKNEFNMSEKEISDLENALNKPLKKSIRVNTRLISIDDFKKIALKNNWTLTESPLWKNMFYIDRDYTNIAIWNTKEHEEGLFYVQEVSASSSPYFMSWDEIDTSEYTILDMSASPWWKTTQLSEYYPNSIIVANEIDKTRLKWLFSNIDRMHAKSVICTNYDWRHFKKLPELFDKILLDAPCSWEWTWFKTDDALKFWNIKNINRIAKLQFWLLESAIISCKTGWEIVYSTCTLNTIENEWVVSKIIEKYWEYLEIIPLTKESKFKRSWPHIDKTGWFFVAKIKKIKNIESSYDSNNLPAIRQNIKKALKTEEKIIIDYINNDKYLKNIKRPKIYTFKWEIFVTDKNLHFLSDKLFFYKIWVSIWKIKNWRFESKL